MAGHIGPLAILTFDLLVLSLSFDVLLWQDKMEDNMKRMKAAFAADKAGKPPSTPAKRSVGSTNGGNAPAKKAKI